MVEVTDSDNHSSLLRLRINYSCNEFIDADPKSQSYNEFYNCNQGHIAISQIFCHFYLSLNFVVYYKSGGQAKEPTRVASRPANRYETRVEVTNNGNHLSLLYADLITAVKRLMQTPKSHCYIEFYNFNHSCIAVNQIILSVFNPCLNFVVYSQSGEL